MNLINYVFRKFKIKKYQKKPKMDSNIKPPDEKYLWRFIDLYKFINLLKSKEIYFSSLNDFDDLFEFTSESFRLKLKSILRITEIQPELRNPKIGNDVFLQKERDFLYLLEKLKIYRMDRFVNCFYASNYESLAMWQLYSGIQGVAIRFKSDSLLDYIKNFYSQNLGEKYQLSANYVEYKNIINKEYYDEDGNIEMPNITFSPFKKDEIYSYEKEYRILLFRYNSIDERPTVKIDSWDNLDFDVYVHSELDNWKIKIIEDLLKEYGIDKRVVKSEIITNKIVEKYKNKFVEDAFRKLM